MLGSHPTTTISSSPPQLDRSHRHQAQMVPLPSYEGCGPVLDTQREGGTRGRSPERPVRYKNEPQLSLWFVFALLSSFTSLTIQPLPSANPTTTPHSIDIPPKTQATPTRTKGDTNPQWRGLPTPEAWYCTTMKGGEGRCWAAHNDVGSPTLRYDAASRRREVHAKVGQSTTTWATQYQGSTPHNDSGRLKPRWHTGPKCKAKGPTTRRTRRAQT
jgi:hypothetical protein